MAKKSTTKEFIEKAIKIHGNRYDYSKVEYVNNYTKVIIICPEHGEFFQRPNTHLTGSHCDRCARILKSSKNPVNQSITTETFIEKSEQNFKVKVPILIEKNPQKMTTYTSETTETIAYERAVKRVKELKGFYGNLISYCIVIPFLVIINLLTSPGQLWFYWPMLGWGIGLLAHGMNVFAIGRNWEEKKIQEIMNKDNFKN